MMFRYKKKRILIFDSIKRADALLGKSDRALMQGKWSGYFLFRHAEDYYLIKNNCPHQNKPIYEGFCEDGKFVCPWHQYAYELKNGRGHGLYLECHTLIRFEDKLFLEKEVFSIF